MSDSFRRVFVALYLANGAAALIYQVVWERVLTFTVGSDARAVTLIVAAFMAGLGIGSALGGAVADRLDGRWRLLAFAGCEIGVAAFAVCSTTWFYDVLYLKLGASQSHHGMAAALGFVALLWPTVLMGMSLPLATRILTRDARRPDEWVSLLYGWNTIGAAAGALIAVAVLFRQVGFTTTVYVGASINLALGICALVIARSSAPVAADAARSDLARRSSPADKPAPAMSGAFVQWLVLYALSGFIALSLEVIWFRILGVVLKSTAMTFGLLLAFYLGGLGAGALGAHALWARRLHPVRSFLACQAAIPIYSALALALLVGAAGQPFAAPLAGYLGAYAGRPGDELFTPLVLFVTVGIPILLVGVPTFLMGLSFGSLQRAAQTDMESLGRRVGWLQAANIFGAVVGTLLTGFVMLDQFGASGTLRVLAALAACFLWVLVVTPSTSEERTRNRALGLGGAVALAAAVLLVPSAHRLWATLHGGRQADTLYAEDGTGVALLKPEPENGTISLYANGRGHSRLPYGGMHTMLGALPVLMHPNPTDVAVIGLGSGDTTYAVAGRRETTRVDSIEIIGAEIAALRQLAAERPVPGLSDLLADPRIMFHTGDGRAFLLRGAKRYDVIEADALWPRTGYSGNMYSVEYLQLLQARLKPGGYAVTWVPTPRVRESLVAVFPYVMIAGQVGMGSDRPFDCDEAVIRRRAEEPFTRAHYASAGIELGSELTPYFSQPVELIGPAHDRGMLTDVNHDLFPKDEFSRRPAASGRR